MKYSIGTLQAMARSLLEAKQSGDKRYMQFVTIFSVRAGLTPEETEAHIRSLAL
jgi:hypothetical protein